MAEHPNLNQFIGQVAGAVGAAVGAAIELIRVQDEEEDYLMQAAVVAAAEMMEIEDEIMADEGGESWVPITVDINEYHNMGDPCFKSHFRMTRPTFEAMCDTLRNHLVMTGRLRRERTPFQDIVLMVLWIMATPDSFRSVALRFGVRPGTLWYHYSYILEALRELAPRYISCPDAAERAEISEAFHRVSGFPNVIGCVDGTHVFIPAPVRNSANFINRHHSYSINVQAVVDHNLLVRDIHVGEPGSMQDRRVFRRSPLYSRLLHGQGITRDQHRLGDGGYTLTDFMMIPFPNIGHRTEEQLNFNKRLSQGRLRVEMSFGLAKEKWRRLKFLHFRNEAILVDHITASFVLHNFIILAGEPIIAEADVERINAHRVLGNEREGEEEHDEENDKGNDEGNQLLQAAQDRGIEKRFHLMHNLPPREE